MAWWLEGATSKHFGWVRNPSKAIFSYFWSQGKNREKSKISGKYRIFSIFPDFLLIFFFRFYFVKIVSMPPENRFFADKSVEKSDFCSLLTTDVEEFRSGMRALEQQPHYSPNVQGVPHPFLHSFTLHAVFNTYSPLHYDGDCGDIPFSRTKEGDELPEMFKTYLSTCLMKLISHQCRQMKDTGWMLMEWKITHAAKYILL